MQNDENGAIFNLLYKKALCEATSPVASVDGQKAGVR